MKKYWQRVIKSVYIFPSLRALAKQSSSHFDRNVVLDCLTCKLVRNDNVCFIRYTSLVFAMMVHRIFTKSQLILLLISIFFPIINATAMTTPCTGHLFNPVTDICWDCLLPITIGSTPVMTGTNPDTVNPPDTICTCGSLPFPKIGVAVGYWEPMELIDVTRSPYCLVSLGGLKLMDSPEDGAVAVDDPNQNTGFFYVHAYYLPIMQFLGVPAPDCADSGAPALIYLSELDPTWNDETLAMILFPETLLFDNLFMQAACSADALTAAVYLPIDSLFWCAGAQGTMYPVTGSVGEYIGGVQASVLMAERLIFRFHRLGLMQDSSATHLCSSSTEVTLPKSRYRYQMTHPIPTVYPTGCQPFGRTTMFWGSLLEPPISTENYGYLIWRKRNCCYF